MHKLFTFLASSATAAVLVFPGTQVFAQSAEDAAAACMEASKLIEEKDFIGALDEAEWCVEGLRQLKQQQTLSVFPDAVEGFVGGDVDNQSAMGMSIIEREYSLDGRSVSVVYTGGVAGGGLAALAQLASGIGAAGGGKKMRVQKRTVIDMSNEGGKAEYMVQFKSGGMLMVSSDELDNEELLEFVKAFPIAELDDSITP